MRYHTDRVRYLRLLARDELVLGEPLPGHVRDRKGRVVLRKGETLTLADLQILDEHVGQDAYVGRDWAPPEDDSCSQATTPEELMEALKRRNPTRGQRARGRRHERHNWRVRLRITVQECSKGMLRRREIEVSTCDVSASGFAFVCQQFIHPGTVLYAHFEALPNRPAMKALVRNCVHLAGRQHRVGAEFVKLELGETVPPN